MSRIVGFLWPLASFGIVFSLALYLLGWITLQEAVIYPIVRVLNGSWFLKTLAMIYALVAIVWKLIKNTKWRLAAVSLVYVGLFFSAGSYGIRHWLNISNVLHMFPYFMFGVLALKSFEPHRKTIIPVLCGAVFCVVVLLEGNVRTNGMGFYWVPTDFQAVVSNKHLFFCFFGRTLTGISGSVFLLWLMDKALKCFPSMSGLAVLGTTTLGVYVLHEWPLVQIHKHFMFQPLSSYWRIPLTLCLFFACHYVTIAIRKYPKANFFFFGDEKWLSEKLFLIGRNKGTDHEA